MKSLSLHSTFKQFNDVNSQKDYERIKVIK